jgi:hypothetical protein
MTRLWPHGKPITVASDATGDPLYFVWQEHRHGVEAITRRWQVDVAWRPARLRRAYFKLSTDTGLLVEIYRDLQDSRWYLQRLYD